MSPNEAVLVALAELLHQEGVAEWSPDGAFSTEGPVVSLADVPTSPDRAVSLNGYVVQDDPAYADTTLAVQVRTRGTSDPRTLWDTANAVFDLLQGMGGVDLGGVHVVECHRQSSANLGRDENRRWEQSDNYYLQVDYPTRHRPF